MNMSASHARLAMAWSSLTALLVPGLRTRPGGERSRSEFEKDCPELDLRGDAASPVDVSAAITPVDVEGDIFHYTSVETFSSPRGSVTVSLVGILKLDKNAAGHPRWTVGWCAARGTASTLQGRRCRRVQSESRGTVFAGWVRIKPPRAG